jgi:glycerate dehydrogenase
MKIAVLNPQNEFSTQQQEALASLGEVVYTQNRDELPLETLLALTKDADILCVDPDPIGGFEKGKAVMTKIMDTLPNLKAVCLSTTSYGWIDLDYCTKRNIPVSNVPGYSRESVAEHTLALLLCLAKRILISDRQTQKGTYALDLGFELKGKTLGIIGLGSIGSRVAELGMAIGMHVVAYNRSPKTQQGVIMKSFDELLAESDAIAFHVTHEEGNSQLIGKEQFSKMKDGVIMVNTADREIIDEAAMAEALTSGKVYGYAYEAEDLENTPLANIENAIGIKGFGWYTKEALNNLFQIFVENVQAAVAAKPQNVVNNV